MKFMRNRTTYTVIAAVLAIVVTYLAGYLPQRGQRLAAEQRAEELDGRMAGVEARVRTAELLGRSLAVKEAAMRNDFGRAGELASPLFDAVRAEVAATPDDALRAGLNDVLGRRDAVTSALARADPASVTALHQIEIRLRDALGYPTTPQAP
jgi:hypothetical protein